MLHEQIGQGSRTKSNDGARSKKKKKEEEAEKEKRKRNDGASQYAVNSRDRERSGFDLFPYRLARPNRPFYGSHL